MTRTFRKKRASNVFVRDGFLNGHSSACKNSGSCNFCRRNRMFDTLKKGQKKLYDDYFSLSVG